MADSFVLLSKSMVQCQRRMTDTDDREDTEGWWRSTLRNDFDECRVKVEAIYRKADIRYAEKTSAILDDVYGPE